MTLDLGASSEIRVPDPRTGNVNGKVGVLYWPARYRSWDDTELLPAAGCEVHLVPSRNRDEEEIYPCGQWFTPTKSDQYRDWMEGNGLISPHPSVLNYVDKPFEGGGLGVIAPVVPAGTLSVAADVQIPAEAGIRLLGLSAEFLGSWQPAFERRVRPSARGALMPAGRAIAGIFDRKSGDAIALSRPVDVVANRTATVRPAPGSDVLVVLRRPPVKEREQLKLTLRIGDGERSPDVFVHAIDAAYAVWYEVEGTSAELRVESDRVFLPPATLALRPKQVTTFREALKKKPRLEVSVDAPEKAFEKMSVGVRRPGEAVEVRHALLHEMRASLVAMPAEQLRVTLHADRWTFTKTVDLSDGSDGAVAFELKPIVVSGRVRYGDKASPARVVFEYGNKDVAAATTDADGRYEVTLWRPALYFAKVKLRDSPVAEFIDPTVSIDGSGTFDFDLPDTRVTVRMVDRATGQRIAGATVYTESQWVKEPVGEVRLAYRYVADGEGTLVLPPLRKGKTTITATAPGYERSALETLIVEGNLQREIVLPLTPADAKRIRLLLPGGAAARGAEACAPDFSWCGTADDDGVLAVPHGDLLIVRHREAASTVLRLPAETLQLRSPAPTPLVLRTTNSAGKIVPYAMVTIWIDGVRLTDAAAAFALWNRFGKSGADGTWLARNAHAETLRVLATARTAPERIASGSYDALGSSIRYPWPAAGVSVPVVP